MATIGFGELGSQLNWHIGHLYYGGSPNKSFYISRSSSIINPDGTANHTPEFTILGNGQVGIGITTPSATLHVNNGDNSYGTILANADESNFSLYAKTITTQPINTESFRLGLKYASDEKNGFISFYRGSGTYGGFLGLSTNGIERVSIDSKGYVGIGRKSPSANLHVQHNGADRASVRVEGKGENNSGARDDISIHGDFVSGTADAASFDRYNVGISSWYGIGFHSSFNNRAGIVFDTRTANAYFDGKVGIGTDAPDSKLTVKGKIHAQEVKVTVSAGETPDYVFKEDYNMMSLEEVERYIKKHSHLPEVKSASQIEEEGLHLAEMNLLLLKKVEELTIHTINQEKEISNLYETVELLINKVNQLEKK